MTHKESSSSSSSAVILTENQTKDGSKNKKDLEIKCLHCRDTQKLICPASESKTRKCNKGLVNVDSKRYNLCPICINGFVRCVACTKCPACKNTYICSLCKGKGTFICSTCTEGELNVNKPGYICEFCTVILCPNCHGSAITNCFACNGSKNCAQCVFDAD